MILAKVSCFLLVLGSVHGLLTRAPPLSGGENPPPDYSRLGRDLLRNRRVWETAVGGGKYEMVIKRQCFCVRESLGPFTLTVANNKVQSVVPNNQYSDGLPTVVGLFDLIQKSIADKVAALTVDYDPQLGYPTNVYVDRDARIADEEIGYQITSLSVKSGPKVDFPHVSVVQPTVCKVRRVSYFELLDRIKDKPKVPGNGFNLAAYAKGLNTWIRTLRRKNCSYTYKFTRVCFCTVNFRGPFLITVKDQKVESAVFAQTGKPVPSDVLANLPTILKLYDIILERAVESDEVEIKYDYNGVPTEVVFDRSKQAFDGGLTLLAELV